MAELAAEAGVTRPILYDHFGDRAGVARALADRYISELEVTLLRAFNQAVPLRVAFAQGVDAFCEFVENDADLYRFLQTAAAPAGPIDSAIGTGLAATIAGALRAAGADETSAPTWGFAVLGMVFAAAEWWSVTRTISRSALVEQVTSLIADGLTGAAIADVLGPFLP
jgi:AcrR family transcriptional regulator